MAASLLLAACGLASASPPGPAWKFTPGPGASADPAAKNVPSRPHEAPRPAPPVLLMVKEPEADPLPAPAHGPPAAIRLTQGAFSDDPGEQEDYKIQLDPPDPQRLFRLESESQFQERMRQEALSRKVPEQIEFPAEQPVSTAAYVERSFPPLAEVVPPAYVCYGRLLFEDINSERYGWDLGFASIFVSPSLFFCDVVKLPYNCGKNPCQKSECSAGYCLPGDPVPYLLYPPEWSISGALAEAGVVLGLIGIFP